MASDNSVVRLNTNKPLSASPAGSQVYDTHPAASFEALALNLYRQPSGKSRRIVEYFKPEVTSFYKGSFQTQKTPAWSKFFETLPKKLPDYSKHLAGLIFDLAGRRGDPVVHIKGDNVVLIDTMSADGVLSAMISDSTFQVVSVNDARSIKHTIELSNGTIAEARDRYAFEINRLFAKSF